MLNQAPRVGAIISSVIAFGRPVVGMGIAEAVLLQAEMKRAFPARPETPPRSTAFRTINLPDSQPGS